MKLEFLTSSLACAPPLCEWSKSSQLVQIDLVFLCLTYLLKDLGQSSLKVSRIADLVAIFFLGVFVKLNCIGDS